MSKPIAITKHGQKAKVIIDNGSLHLHPNLSDVHLDYDSANDTISMALTYKGATYEYRNNAIDLVTIGGVVIDSEATFDTQVEAVFPNPNGGAGGSAQNFDEVLAEPGSLTANRTVYLDGCYFAINQDGNAFLTIDPTPDAEVAEIKAYNSTGGGNVSFIYNDARDILAQTVIQAYFDGEKQSCSLGFGTGAIDANFNLDAIFNEGETQAIIHGAAQSGISTLAYTADTHTFNGAIINTDLVAANFADDAAAATGLVAVGGLYHTAGVVKVRLA